MFARLFLLPIALLIVAAPVFAEQSSEDIMAMFEARNRAIAQTMEGATVFVLVDKGNSVNLGSGFVVADGYVMTNGHVLGKDYKKSQRIIIMNPRITPADATLVKMDYRTKRESDNDMALLRFKPSSKLPVLTFNTKIERMDRVSAWGFPAMVLEHDQTLENILSGELRKTPPVVFTDGTVNTIVTKNDLNTIIHSAAIASGNSGGPLINSRGEVVGINTWGYMADDEGAFYNASQPAERIIAFLRASGVNPAISTRHGGALPRQETPIVTADASRSEGPDSAAATGHADSDDPPAGGSAAAGNAGGGSFMDKIVGSSGGTSQPAPQPTQASPAENSGNDSPAALIARAKQGDADAQCALGYSFFSGEDNLPFGKAEAMQWLRASGKQGNKDAQSLLTVLLYDGESVGVPRDVDECFVWAQKAAQGGDSEGKGYLAMLYFYGEGVEQDVDKALDLAKEAAREDNSKGKSMLAWMHYLGVGMPEDNGKALKLAQEAAEDEDPSAQGLLAEMYYTGNGVKRDLNAAEGWARRAADQVNEFGQYVLARLYLNGDVVRKDIPTALAYLEMAAEKNHQDAMDELEKLRPRISKEDQKKARALEQQWRAAWNG